MSQLDVVPLDIDKQLRAFEESKIDAVVTFEPVRSMLLEQGGRQLFDSSQTPGEIVDVLVVRESFLKKYPQRIEALKHSWFKALKYFANNPHLAAQQISTRMKLSPEETLDSYIGLRLPDLKQSDDLLGNGKQAKLLATSEKLASIMVDNKLMVKKIDTSVLFPVND
ncbi:MAG: ABC transporter substrate-binding protein [Gammaproteobacteria bacterium]|nr:ABC transporter substrate-binding protein [Gammaproteobacteria bacterium]